MAKKFNGPGVYFLRGALYAQMKDYDKALQDADAALERDPNMLQAIRLKGLVLIQREEYDKAIRVLEQLRRKSNDKAEKLEATQQIAYVVSKQGYYKRASEMLKKELEKTPENAELIRSLADMELLFGHWQNAIDLYEKLITIDPKDSGALNNYSWLLSTCPDEAFRNGERALEMAKTASEETFYKQPHILSTLAAAYAELGDFETARSWSQKAVELGEKTQHESLDSLKKELETYKENKPWREEESEIMTEIEDEAAPAAENKDNEQMRRFPFGLNLDLQ
jgi:tetratricopeptide (TPR) repeat protein